MLYNIPEITDFVSFLQFLQSIMPFAQLSLLAIFFGSFFALKRYETTKVLPASLLITFISSLAFYLIEFARGKLCLWFSNSIRINYSLDLLWSKRTTKLLTDVYIILNSSSNW